MTPVDMDCHFGDRLKNAPTIINPTGNSSTSIKRSWRNTTPNRMVIIGWNRHRNEAMDGSRYASPFQVNKAPAPLITPIKAIHQNRLTGRNIDLPCPPITRRSNAYPAAEEVHKNVNVSGLNLFRANFTVTKFVVISKAPRPANKKPLEWGLVRLTSGPLKIPDTTNCFIQNHFLEACLPVYIRLYKWISTASQWHPAG